MTRACRSRGRLRGVHLPVLATIVVLAVPIFSQNTFALLVIPPHPLLQHVHLLNIVTPIRVRDTTTLASPDLSTRRVHFAPGRQRRSSISWAADGNKRRVATELRSRSQLIARRLVSSFSRSIIDRESAAQSRDVMERPATEVRQDDSVRQWSVAGEASVKERLHHRSVEPCFEKQRKRMMERKRWTRWLHA